MVPCLPERQRRRGFRPSPQKKGKRQLPFFISPTFFFLFEKKFGLLVKNKKGTMNRTFSK
jgi:hypothetical protein